MRLAAQARARVAGVLLGDLSFRLVRWYALATTPRSSPSPTRSSYAGALGPATPFVADIWTDQGMQDRCNTVARSVAWLPAIRDDGDGRVETQPSAGDSSVRVDISRPCHSAPQIALFEPGVRAVRPRLVASEGWV